MCSGRKNCENEHGISRLAGKNALHKYLCLDFCFSCPMNKLIKKTAQKENQVREFQRIRVWPTSKNYLVHIGFFFLCLKNACRLAQLYLIMILKTRIALTNPETPHTNYTMWTALCGPSSGLRVPVFWKRFFHASSTNAQSKCIEMLELLRTTLFPNPFQANKFLRLLCKNRKTIWFEPLWSEMASLLLLIYGSCGTYKATEPSRTKIYNDQYPACKIL